MRQHAADRRSRCGAAPMASAPPAAVSLVKARTPTSTAVLLDPVWFTTHGPRAATLAAPSLQLLHVPFGCLPWCKVLRRVDLHNNHLERLPPDFAAVRGHLIDCDLSGNHFAEVPPPLAGAAVQTLDMSDNRLRSCDVLRDLGALRMLDLSQNFLHGDLVVPPSLEYLDASANPLTRFPSFANGPMVHLTVLDLSCAGLPSIAGVGRLTALRKLILRDNFVEAIDARELASLRNLRTLDLSSNRLERLEGIEALPALEELVIDDNQLVALPIGGSLIRLWANGNAMGALPAAMASMTQLEMLAVSDCAITTLPPADVFRAMTALVEVYLSGNPVALAGRGIDVPGVYLDVGAQSGETRSGPASPAPPVSGALFSAPTPDLASISAPAPLCEGLFEEATDWASEHLGIIETR